MEHEKRIEWIDFLRVFSIFAAVLCHVTESVYKLNIDYVSELSMKSEVYCFFMFTLGRLGVPCFLMISGYLLLDRSYDFGKTKYFWKNNWFHLLLCTEIWFIIYEIYLIVYERQEIGISKIIMNLSFSNGLGMGHVWYLPMILGMYILVPFVANALRVYETKDLYFPVLFFSLFAFGHPLLKVINGVLGNDGLSMQMSLGFSGGCYGIYFVMGYMVKKGTLKKVRTSLLVVSAALSFVAGIGLQIWAYSYSYKYNIWYDCPFILIASTALFELFSRLSYVPAYRVVKWLSCYSFAVYLIHMIIRNVIKSWILNFPCMQPIKVMLLYLLVLGLSFMAAWLISKIPWVGKYILYIK